MRLLGLVGLLLVPALAGCTDPGPAAPVACDVHVAGAFVLQVEAAIPDAWLEDGPPPGGGIQVSVRQRSAGQSALWNTTAPVGDDGCVRIPVPGDAYRYWVEAFAPVDGSCGYSRGGWVEAVPGITHVDRTEMGLACA